MHGRKQHPFGPRRPSTNRPRPTSTPRRRHPRMRSSPSNRTPGRCGPPAPAEAAASQRSPWPTQAAARIFPTSSCPLLLFRPSMNAVPYFPIDEDRNPHSGDCQKPHHLEHGLVVGVRVSTHPRPHIIDRSSRVTISPPLVLGSTGHRVACQRCIIRQPQRSGATRPLPPGSHPPRSGSRQSCVRSTPESPARTLHRSGATHPPDP